MPAVSPNDPEMLPNINGFKAVAWCWNFARPSGEAEVITSTLDFISGAAMVLGSRCNMPCRGATQVVIVTGKAACKNARPTSAGLKILRPRPPQIILPNAMATMLPSSAIHSGMAGGKVSANKMPVRIPEPSLSELKLRRSDSAHSVPAAPITQVLTIKSAVIPK
jgi:hypothetical protein